MKLKFQPLALCQSEGLLVMLKISASLSLYGGNLTLIDLFHTKLSLFHFPTDSAPQFLSKVTLHAKVMQLMLFIGERLLEALDANIITGTVTVSPCEIPN